MFRTQICIFENEIQILLLQYNFYTEIGTQQVKFYWVCNVIPIQESLLASIVTVGGVKTVADMLNKMGPKSSDILSNISGIDPILAGKIKENMFIFEDLLELEQAHMMKVIGNVETEDLTVALKNSPPEEMDIIKGAMSQRAKDRFNEEFEMLGKTKIKDIEEAQKKILEVAMRLLESGEIERAEEEE